jgi:hypothetical protein
MDETQEDAYTCNKCPAQYKEPCVKAYGEFTGHGDDHTAIEGSHFCRFSWSGFKPCGAPLDSRTLLRRGAKLISAWEEV